MKYRLPDTERQALEDAIVRFLQTFASNKDYSFSPGELARNAEGPGIAMKHRGEEEWAANCYRDGGRSAALRDPDWRRSTIRAACERLVKAGRIGVDRCCSSPYRPNGDGVRGYWAGEDNDHAPR